ncbi:MAG: hypothetical protein QM648_10300 [Solirubrobacterales bacterium]
MTAFTEISRDPAIATALDHLGVRRPVAGERVKLLFVGQRTYFESSALNHATDEIEPRFVDLRDGDGADAVVREIESFSPDVVIVFRPEIVPRGLFHDVDALTVGFLTEPLPRATAQDQHPDLKRRLAYLGGIDAGNFDRVISFDPLVVESASEHVEIWRSMPLPVADEFFMPVERWTERPRPVFFGRSTRHREAWLLEAKHRHDVLHIAHGVFGDELLELMKKPTVSLNIHNEDYPTFEVRVTLCLAAGHLVVSEPLSPSHGFEPDIDYVEVIAISNLNQTLGQVWADPNVFHRLRVTGRMKAEHFRASTVYPRLISDLYTDVAVRGRGRS